MGIKTTYKINRAAAIERLRAKGVTVFDDDCNERLAYLLEESEQNDFENYQVVDYAQEMAERNGHRWPYWKTT